MESKGTFEERDCQACEGTGKVKVRTKSAQARMSRNKGNSNELRVAKMISEAIKLPYEQCRRTPNSGALIERGDLRMSVEALRRFPWFIEVKARESWEFHQVFSKKPDSHIRWEPVEWFTEAQFKAASDARNGFGDGVQHPVLLVLLRNRRVPLAMFHRGALGSIPADLVTMRVDNYCIMPFETLLVYYTQQLLLPIQVPA